MKDQLCRAFCDDLQVREVPAGLAISTTFATPDGDRIGFYVTRMAGSYRIEDDGLTWPALEASMDFGSGTRGDALAELLAEYGVAIDEDSQEFFVENVAEAEVPAAALRFVAFCLRVRDFMLMTEYRVANTFREDAERALRDVIGDRAKIEKNVPITDKLSDFNADFVIRPKDRPPVGVFLGISDNRVLEALFLHMRVRHEIDVPCSIVALLETGHSLTAKVRQQAANRLNAVTEFRGDEAAAIQRIAEEAFGRQYGAESVH